MSRAIRIGVLLFIRAAVHLGPASWR